MDLIKEEINVKEIALGAPIKGDVELDTALTPELREEGELRELLRKIQDLRKESGLSVKDKAVLVATDDLKGLISKHEKEICDATNVSSIEYGAAFGLR